MSGRKRTSAQRKFSFGGRVCIVALLAYGRLWEAFPGGSGVSSVVVVPVDPSGQPQKFVWGVREQHGPAQQLVF